MRARIIGTDKFIDVRVELFGSTGEIYKYYNLDEKACFSESSFEPHQLELYPIDWEQRRFDLIKDIIKGMFADGRGEIYTRENMCKEAIGIADEMIKQLKEKSE